MMIIITDACLFELRSIPTRSPVPVVVDLGTAPYGTQGVDAAALRRPGSWIRVEKPRLFKDERRAVVPPVLLRSQLDSPGIL
ncbi:hypothetical protein PC9H_002469, partial [Pleurotus ostreatus]